MKGFLVIAALNFYIKFDVHAKYFLVLLLFNIEKTEFGRMGYGAVLAF